MPLILKDISVKIIWEAQDVMVGMRLRTASNKHKNYIIGFDPGVDSRSGQGRYTITSLEDGMLCDQGLTLEALAENLNKRNFMPNKLAEMINIVNKHNAEINRYHPVEK